MLIASIIIFICILLSRVSLKVGIPALLLFITLGMIFTSPSFLNIHFENYRLTEAVSSIALLFIIFYGGFGTRWQEAKKISKEAILLSSIGVLATALLLTFLIHVILGIDYKSSFLLSSVISSTDAASVFSIIRSRKLSLKYNTSALLELESGSNDPFSYLLTLIAIGIYNGSMNLTNATSTLVLQISIALITGAIISIIATKIIKKVEISEGLDTVFIFSVAILSYAITNVLKGNGYLSVYILGIVLGNSQIRNKIRLVHFFDGITSLMQMTLFFMLGFLSEPSKVISNLPFAFIIFLLLTVIARPAAVFSLLSAFKTPCNKSSLVSFAGLRGAASIVFAILSVNNAKNLNIDVFHITFGVVLFSILLQGSFLPYLAKRINMTDKLIDPMISFTDYVKEKPVEFINFTVGSNHPWVGNRVNEIPKQNDLLLTLIKRDNQYIVPEGNITIETGDNLICIAKTYTDSVDIELNEEIIDKDFDNLNKSLVEVDTEDRIYVLVRRGEEFIIPDGEYRFKEKDKLLFLKRKDM